MKTEQITFIFNDIVGGIATMNLGIIKQGNLCDFFNVRVILINREEKSNSRIKIEKIDSRIDVIYFKYSPNDNYYYVIKRLKKLLEHNQGAIITNDGIELDCLKFKGNNQVIYHIVHDLYNFRLAVNNKNLIDYFICHTVETYKLLCSDPLLNSRVFYLPFGVDIPLVNLFEKKKRLKVVSLSRLVENKGVLKLILIERELIKLGVDVDWIILGAGPLKQDLQNQWFEKNNVVFDEPNDLELKNYLLKSDLFVSLSRFEGYGISLLEAMSFGLVPIITRLPIGIHGILTNKTGLVVEEIDYVKIANFIKKLAINDSKLFEYRKKAYDFIELNYSSKKTGYAFSDLFKRGLKKKTFGEKIKDVSNFGIFDHKLLPNIVSANFKLLKKSLQ